MSWNRLSFHFKQTHAGGYRYLDRCGEFMVEAVEKFRFIPGEIKVTGARLEIPEEGITADADPQGLNLTQEFPKDDGTMFLSLAEGLAKLTSEFFTPKAVMTRGLAVKSYWPMKSEEAVLKASLNLGGSYHSQLGKSVGMVPSRKNIDLNFTSGSLDFHVMVHPVSFEKVSVQRFNPGFDVTPEHKERLARLNRKADRIDLKSPYAIMMELDLIESDPPVELLAKHFDQLKKQEAILMEELVIK